MASVKGRMMCPNTGDDAHRIYKHGTSGPRNAYFYGYTEDGRKVYLCADCGLAFDEHKAKVRLGVSVIDEDDLPARSSRRLGAL